MKAKSISAAAVPAVKLVPRRSGSQHTRQAILAAGRSLFAKHGYGQTSLRDVALLANANVSLVNRYFGSKDGLFRAALENAISVEPLLDIPLTCFGEEVMRRFFVAEDSFSPLAMTTFSAADPAACAIASDIVHNRVVIPLARHLGEPNGENRAARLIMLWSGFMLGRRLSVGVAGGDVQGSDATRRWLRDATQAIIDEVHSAEA